MWYCIRQSWNNTEKVITIRGGSVTVGRSAVGAASDPWQVLKEPDSEVMCSLHHLIFVRLEDWRVDPEARIAQRILGKLSMHDQGFGRRILRGQI